MDGRSRRSKVKAKRTEVGKAIEKLVKAGKPLS